MVSTEEEATPSLLLQGRRTRTRITLDHAFLFFLNAVCCPERHTSLRDFFFHFPVFKPKYQPVLGDAVISVDWCNADSPPGPTELTAIS